MCFRASKNHLYIQRKVERFEYSGGKYKAFGILLFSREEIYVGQAQTHTQTLYIHEGYK